MVGLGVIGLEHMHVLEMVDGLVGAGATTVSHTSVDDSLADLYASWRQDSRPTDAASVLSDPDVDLVVLAGVPAERAGHAVAALRAGKDVLTAKPGAVTVDQLGAVRAAADDAGGRWWVMFSERLANPAVLGAVELARAGAIGRVVHVEGTAPHRLSAADRPAWFFDRARAGGIVVDLCSHQVDQFLALTGADAASVEVAAAVGSTRRSEVGPVPAGFEDLGELWLAAPGVRGHHRVDWLEPDGFPTWGDVRLVVTGTDGRLDVRIPVDLGGGDAIAGRSELRVTDHDGVRVVEDLPSPTWAADLLADRLDRGERLMSFDHPYDVTGLTLRAAAVATGWGSGGGPA